MKYNLFVSTSSGTFNIIDVDDSDLEKVVRAYKLGLDSIFLQGKKFWLANLSEIQIFTFENEKIKTEKELKRVCAEDNVFERGYLGIH